MEKYRSRKFLVTVGAMVLGMIASMYGKMDGDLAIVLAAGIGAYNWANIQANNNGEVK